MERNLINNGLLNQTNKALQFFDKLINKNILCDIHLEFSVMCLIAEAIHED